MSICIAGKGYIAVQALGYLQEISRIKLYAMPLANDTGADTWMPSLKRFADKIGVECLSFDDCQCTKPSTLISLEYDKIFRLHKWPDTKIFNIHFSKLPAYKGMATSSWPIFNGETEVGVTLHEVDHGIDTGPIIAQDTFLLDDHETAETLYYKFHQNGFKLFRKNITSLINGDYTATLQPSIGSSYYSNGEFEFSKDLNMNKTAAQISNEFRSKFFPVFQFPKWRGMEFSQLEILRVRSTVKAGNILTENSQFITVSTIDYDIKLFLRN